MQYKEVYTALEKLLKSYHLKLANTLIVQTILLRLAGIETYPGKKPLGGSMDECGNDKMFLEIHGISKKEAEIFHDFLKRSLDPSEVFCINSYYNKMEEPRDYECFCFQFNVKQFHRNLLTKIKIYLESGKDAGLADFKFKSNAVTSIANHKTHSKFHSFFHKAKCFLLCEKYENKSQKN